MLLGFVFSSGHEFYQERKTGKALEALKNLPLPMRWLPETVKRSRSHAENWLRAIWFLSEGERVAADGIHCIPQSQVDESFLRESVPVRKIESDGTKTIAVTGGGDILLFLGTMVYTGNGVAQVLKPVLKPNWKD